MKIKRLKKVNFIFLFISFIMMTSLASGAVKYRYIRKDYLVKSTVRKIPKKQGILGKICWITGARSLFLCCAFRVFHVSFFFGALMQIIILAMPVSYFFLWRSETHTQMKMAICLYNVLAKSYRLGLWLVIFRGLEASCSFPIILGRSQMVAINKEENIYKIEIKGPITYSINANSALDRDILIAILDGCRTLDGQKIIVQQALAESFGLKDRREIDNRMQRYRKSGQSLIGIIAPHISKSWVLTKEVKEAIGNFWTKNWWASEEEVFNHLQQIGLFKPNAKFSSSTIRAAVSKDFLRLRSQVKKAFLQGLISYKNEELLKQLFELLESQTTLLKQHNLLPEVEELKINTIKTFSRCGSLKKELKQTARIKNIKQKIMNPQTQDLRLSTPLQAIKFYAYFNSSYGRVAQYLKVSKSSVFYWTQSFILFLEVTYLFPPKCSGVVGFDAKWVKITKSFSKEERLKGHKWRYVFIAIDCHTYDLLHIQILPKEDRNCTKLFLLKLKNKGFYPKVIITDMHIAYPGPIKEVFPKAQHAICIFHLLQAAQRNIKEVFGKDYKKNKEVAALKKEIYHLFDAKDKRTVMKRMETFMAKREHFVSIEPKASKIFNSIQSHFSQALLSIGNPKIPSTNNIVERVNRRFNQHYKNMAGFESMSTARAYLTLFAFFYRITPFYEAKDKRIRGMAPIQIAGVDIDNIPAVKAFGII
jgi:transposase-like protein